MVRARLVIRTRAICSSAPAEALETEGSGEADRSLGDRVAKTRFLQFIFYRQWAALKGYANRRKIQILGDIPIYVNHDSADVWSHRELFKLDENNRPAAVSGVPPSSKPGAPPEDGAAAPG